MEMDRNHKSNAVPDDALEGFPVASPEIPFDPIMAPPAKASASKVSELDVLRYKYINLEFEKFHIEVNFWKQQVAMATQQLSDRERVRTELLARAAQLQTELKGRYGIDIQAGKINDDGSFSANSQRPPSGS